MRARLVAEVVRRGVINRRTALSLVPEHVLDDALTDGVLVRLYPETYTVPQFADRLLVRRRGALIYRPDVALSHLDGLDVHHVLPYVPGPDWTIHVTGGRREPYIDWPGLKLHRRRGFDIDGSAVIVRRGLRVVRLEQAIVESWMLIPELDRRVPVIVAARERRTTGARLLTTLRANWRVEGAAEMRRVFNLVATGCHSPLELWGHEHVFDDPALPAAVRQYPVELPTGRIYLDRYYEEEQVDVELDGAAFHGQPGQRERDNRRDASVAVQGIQTVRFSHPRLHGDPRGVRMQLLEILRTRRRQLGLPAA